MSTTFTYTTIDGQRVEKRVAEDFERMAAAFKAQFGVELLITSGVRTIAEQQALYEKFLAGRGNQATKPNGSRHQIESSIGPRALDLRDSGRDPGVKFIGTKRNNWLSKNAPRFNFLHTGKTFKQPEAWHFEWQGSFAGSAPAVPPAQNTGGLDLSSKATPNKYGLDNVLGLQKISRMYAPEGQKTAIDNDWGPKSEAGMDIFLETKYGSQYDKGLAKWLRTRWGYEGNNVYGPVMKAALERANEANFKAL